MGERRIARAPPPHGEQQPSSYVLPKIDCEGAEVEPPGGGALLRSIPTLHSLEGLDYRVLGIFLEAALGSSVKAVLHFR